MPKLLILRKFLWSGNAFPQWDVLFILVLDQRANTFVIFWVALNSSVVQVFGLGDSPFCRDVYNFFSWRHLWRMVFLDLGAVFECWIFDWFLWTIEMLDLLAQSHSSLAYIQIGRIIALYNNNLFPRGMLDCLPIIQLKCFTFRSICFRFLTMYSFHVSLLYLNISCWWWWDLDII